MYESTDVSPRFMLVTLFWLRNVVAIGQASTVFFVNNALGIPIPISNMLLAIVVLLAWNLVTANIIRRDRQITHEIVLLNLVIDISIMVALFYFTGGVTNPFITFLLIPVAFAATFLSRRHIGLLCAYVIASYSLIMIYSIALPSQETIYIGNTNLGTLTTWVNFSVSALLVGVFINRFSSVIRQRDRDLAEAEVKLMENKKILALGSMAAGVAHAINTPLSTIAVLAGDLRERSKGKDSQELDVLRQQVDLCRDKLAEFVDQTSQLRASKGQELTVSEFLNRLGEEVCIVYPEIRLHKNFELGNNQSIVADLGIAQAISNTLINAAEASLQNNRIDIELHGRIVDGTLKLTVSDYGKGLHMKEGYDLTLGEKSEKVGGMGLGIALSKQNLSRFGGTMAIRNRDDGTDLDILLPLEKIILN